MTQPPPSTPTPGPSEKGGVPAIRRSRRLPLPVLAGLFAASLAVVLIAGLFLRSTRQLAWSSGRVAHTLDVINEAEQLLSLMKDAETGQRGYLLTHEEHFLAPYEGAQRHIRPSLERLRTLTSDDARQQQRLERMEALIQRKLVLIERTVQLERQGQSAAALEAIRSGAGERLMDELRVLERELREEAQKRLERQNARLERTSRSADVLVLSGSGFLLAFIGFTAVSFLRDFRTREREVADREAVLAREQAAQVQAEAERQRARFQAILTQVPAAVGVYRAPDQLCELANPGLQRLHGGRTLIGRTAREAHPEYANAGLFEVFDNVFRTGQPYTATARRLMLDRNNDGQRVEGYFNFTYQPLLDTGGQVEAVLLFAVEVTEQVYARQAAEEALAHRQRAEAALRDSEAHLRRTLKAAEVGAWEWELRSQRVVWSPNLEAMYGMMPGTFGGTLDACLALVHPEERELVARTLEQTARERGEYQLEYRVLRADGRVRWQESRGRVLLDEHGQPTKLSGVVLDITTRKHAEQQQRETEAHFQLLAETLPQLIWRARTDGHVEYLNPGWYEYTGQTPEQALAEGWLQALHPEDQEDTLAAWRRAVSTGEPYAVEYRMRRASDGAYRWFIARSLPLRDGLGRIKHWFGTSTDIDDQKRGVESLRYLSEASAALATSLDQEATLKQVARLAVPVLADWCMVDLVGEDGRVERVDVTHADPSLTELANRLRHFPPVHNPEHPSARAMRLDQTVYVAEVTREFEEHSAQGTEHLLAIRETRCRSMLSVPLVARGRTLGVLTFLTTEGSGRRYERGDVLLAEEVARRVALALDNARLFSLAQEERQRAEEANRLKDDFLATVSHELRTPLTAMIGWLKMLRTGRLSPDKHAKALETVDRNTQAQAQLIEDLLDVSRIISGKLRMETQPVHLADTVQAAMESVRPAADAKAIRLLAELEPDEHLVMGDAGRLQQVMWNLLSNAVKFSPGGSRVWVRLRRVESSVEVTVADEGPGVPADFLPHIFERFRQLEGGTTRRHGGLGLGLSIVRHLVELHGGTVQAASEGPGRGASFTIHLPLAQSRLAPPERPAARPTLPPTHAVLAQRRILVVDDEEDNREVLKVMLEEYGAHVVTAASAAEALRAVREGRPELLVSDIGMPGEDGYRLIAQVRALSVEEGGGVPAVALTAYARVEDRARALTAGFNMHVAKPVEPTELLSILSNLVTLSSGS
ncbi:PAS domain-containing protein [Archangium lansingense]|uniref:histidine kinase n=1 Tax=Archangium lansingense TaxID=2995310 RepID=A0ABT4AHQ1_9BACT|nr:PAS domain-containing protein [Archangium lansinium]MCY1081207.1 PAS domain-containing protein [Archangium lansinium]